MEFKPSMPPQLRSPDRHVAIAAPQAAGENDQPTAIGANDVPPPTKDPENDLNS